MYAKGGLGARNREGCMSVDQQHDRKPPRGVGRQGQQLGLYGSGENRGVPLIHMYVNPEV